MFKKISNIFITIIIFLITIILLKSSVSFKSWFNQHVLDNHFKFTKVASMYESLFGSPLPFNIYKESPVFNEKLEYTSKEKYKDGVLLKLSNNLVPSIDKGLIIFIGNKDNKTCITIESSDHDTTYCGFTNVGVKLYDHVDLGDFLGEVDETLILYFSFNGESLNYEEFI